MIFTVSDAWLSIIPSRSVECLLLGEISVQSATTGRRYLLYILIPHHHCHSPPYWGMEPLLPGDGEAGVDAEGIEE